ncbi:Replication protein A 70 kDa DNA-binding subunit B [Linum grandiflorum]
MLRPLSHLNHTSSFHSLSSRAVSPPCPYLTDFLGKVIALGKPNYVSRGLGVVPVQTVVVVDASGLEVDVSLWYELSNVLDVDTIPLDDMSNPIIVAFLSVRIRAYMGKTTASSGLASRIVQDLLHPAAESLRVHFAGQQRSVRYIVPKFDSPEKMTKHMQESYHTIRELDEMYIVVGDSEPCYRCSAEIIGFYEHPPWFYRVCPECSSAVVPYGSDFWCRKHDTVPSAAVAHRYRLKLLVSDSTSTSTFVLHGHSADRIMPIPASELVVAYPDDYGTPPPPLQRMIGQKVVFGVHLPRHVHVSFYEDFKISKIWGLNMPRTQLLAQLPPPHLPQRTPSPPSRHEIPIPSDPAYVPHVPTYCERSALPNLDPVEPSSVPSASLSTVTGTPGKRKAASASSEVRSNPAPAKTKSAIRAASPKTPAQPHSRPASFMTSLLI